MLLHDELTATAEKVRAALPPPIFDAIERSVADLRDTGIAQGATGVGARPALPTLNDADGHPFDLAAQAAKGPLVLVFYRGGWCPYCDVTLRALQAALREVRELSAQLVAVTPEQPERIEETVGRAGVAFPVLHDSGNAFAQSLGLVFSLPESLRPQYAALGIDLPAFNGDATFSLPVPATYVLDRDGTVAYAFVDADFKRRAEPAAILAALRSLPRQ